MKKLAIAASLIVAIASAGCLNGRSGPGQLTRSHLQFEKSKSKGEILDLDNHQDVEIDELERVASDGSTVKLKGYRSQANKSAVDAAVAQAGMARQSFKDMFEMFREFGGMAAQAYSGGVVKPAPQVVIVTNYVPVVAGTNAVPK